MGQQQLLLLVLATVIVGLATVAGIQAFDENQSQASQDALVQRGTEIASQIVGLQGRPTQMGGVDILNNTYSGTEIANRLGYDHTNGVVDAEGAGSSGVCKVKGNSSAGDPVNVNCASNDAPQDIQVTFDPTVEDQVTTSYPSGSLDTST